MVRAALAVAHGWDEDAVAIDVIRTSGDRIQDRPLSEVGGKGLSPRKSKMRCCPARSIWRCIRPRTCQRCCPTG